MNSEEVTTEEEPAEAPVSQGDDQNESLDGVVDDGPASDTETGEQSEEVDGDEAPAGSEEEAAKPAPQHDKLIQKLQQELGNVKRKLDEVTSSSKQESKPKDEPAVDVNLKELEAIESMSDEDLMDPEKVKGAFKTLTLIIKGLHAGSQTLATQTQEARMAEERRRIELENARFAADYQTRSGRSAETVGAMLKDFNAAMSEYGALSGKAKRDMETYVWQRIESKYPVETARAKPPVAAKPGVTGRTQPPKKITQANGRVVSQGKQRVSLEGTVVDD